MYQRITVKHSYHIRLFKLSVDQSDNSLHQWKVSNGGLHNTSSQSSPDIKKHQILFNRRRNKNKTTFPKFIFYWAPSDLATGFVIQVIYLGWPNLMKHSCGKWHTPYYHITFIPDTRISMVYASIQKQYQLYNTIICSSLACKHLSCLPLHGNWSYKGLLVVSPPWSLIVKVCMEALEGPLFWALRP